MPDEPDQTGPGNQSGGTGGMPEDPSDLAAAALRAAQEAVSALTSGAKPGERTPQPFSMASFSVPDEPKAPKGLDLLSDVNVNVTIELGRTRMLVEDVLRLSEGAVVELDKLAGDPVDVFVNERLVARGEVLVLNDNFCIRVNEILDADQAERV
jgi:flagellar motor switch protein FliN/FliY